MRHDCFMRANMSLPTAREEEGVRRERAGGAGVGRGAGGGGGAAGDAGALASNDAQCADGAAQPPLQRATYIAKRTSARAAHSAAWTWGSPSPWWCCREEAARGVQREGGGRE